MNGKVKDIYQKLTQINERESGYFVDGRAIMKGSTLTFNIIEGEFDD